ncbi:hypothetical protein XENTR_v10015789 [Xenopus tropicalis]|uniref:Uncharacterized protein LOC116411734 n=1 Tax=Xenopus tropicalis TaxID=8364 RepID=A0A8J1JRA9_XENTR|nr:uncharacterized protein LOC116411734 [Xenopus tropicalis]KAE8595537.1 hypothetical protein XENTR_v10015789 [Xenopus tropicalis]
MGEATQEAGKVTSKPTSEDQGTTHKEEENVGKNQERSKGEEHQGKSEDHDQAETCPWGDSSGSAIYIYNRFLAEAKYDGSWMLNKDKLAALMKCLTVTKRIKVQSAKYSYFQALVEDGKAKKDQTSSLVKQVTKKLEAIGAPKQVKRKFFILTAKYLYYRSLTKGVPEEQMIQDPELQKVLIWTAKYLYFLSLINALTDEMLQFQNQQKH